MRRALAAREVSAVELTRDSITRLVAVQRTIGAVAALDPERSLADAARSDARIADGTDGSLEGVPITVKDWIDVEGWPITGSAVRPSRPPRESRRHCGRALARRGRRRRRHHDRARREPGARGDAQPA